MVGRIGATCGGCIWLRELGYGDGLSVHGCAYVARMAGAAGDLERVPIQRACAAWTPSNGQVTAPFFPHREPR